MTSDDHRDPTGQLAAEQAVVDRLYLHLDALRAATERHRDDAVRAPLAGTPGSHGERDALFTAYQNRLVQLRAVEDRLCFGRLDLREQTRRYVGRIGLSDDQQAQLLVDWRAPAAEPFYQATAAEPGDVVRRRHIATKARTVTSLDDEVFDLDALGDTTTAGLAGDGALMAALDERRTGRMRDIVATIQSEQDRVIRAPLAGILVVQGGPGTGKTAVALHRAAYLLYTHRERIARSGVLLVGPNPAFLRYIERVLPSLGETGVVTRTQGELFPGVTATAEEDRRAAALKGDARMAAVIRAAVRDRQRVPERTVELKVDGHQILLRPSDVAAARARARAGGRPHNRAREIFVKDLLTRLARQLAHAQRRGVDSDGPEDLTDLMADLRDSPDVRREVNLCWLPLTPQRLVAQLWSDPHRLASAAPYLPAAERRLLHRPIEAPFTPADVPLLDEAAELLGEDDSAERAAAARARAERAHELEYAKGVVDMSSAAYAGQATGWLMGSIGAEALADRYAGDGASSTVAERAAEDRTWTFGHVVVDEAQELSPMMWRLLVRRCPSRSMTVVGDLAQNGSLAGAPTWAEALDPHAAGRWSLRELTVNYRTPGQVMDLAARMLTAAGVPVTPPTSAREGLWPPQSVRVQGYDDGSLAPLVQRELAAVDGGTVAVITPGQLSREVLAGLKSKLGPELVRAGTDGLEAPVAVLSVSEVKGLEFDSCVVVAPDQMMSDSPRGPNDLYVALTRCTQRLVIAHTGPLPDSLTGLDGSEPVA